MGGAFSLNVVRNGFHDEPVFFYLSHITRCPASVPTSPAVYFVLISFARRLLSFLTSPACFCLLISRKVRVAVCRPSCVDRPPPPGPPTPQAPLGVTPPDQSESGTGHLARQDFDISDQSESGTGHLARQDFDVLARATRKE